MTAAAAVLGCALVAGLGAEVVRLRRRMALVADAEHEIRGPATVLALALERMAHDPFERPRAVRGALDGGKPGASLAGGKPGAGPEGGQAAALQGELERLRTALADLSAARRGRRASVAPEDVEVERLVREAAAAWRRVLGPAGRDVRLSWRGGPALVRANPGRLAQAFGNLLANAAEHGTGLVDVRGGPVGDRVRVEIHNDTPGSRAAPERATNAGLPAAVEADRGRGLSIARAAAEASGGRLEVHVGESAAAVVELPRRGTHAAG